MHKQTYSLAAMLCGSRRSVRVSASLLVLLKLLWEAATAVWGVYLHAAAAAARGRTGCRRRSRRRGGGPRVYCPARLLGQLAEELWLQLRDVEALLDGVGGQHHVVVDAGGIQNHGGEQLQGLREDRKKNVQYHE